LINKNQHGTSGHDWKHDSRQDVSWVKGKIKSDFEEAQQKSAGKETQNSGHENTKDIRRPNPYSQKDTRQEHIRQR
jgi:hypothetical protein